jgi:hypothetical protein
MRSVMFSVIAHRIRTHSTTRTRQHRPNIPFAIKLSVHHQPWVAQVPAWPVSFRNGTIRKLKVKPPSLHALPLPPSKRTHQLQPNGLPDDHVHNQSLHLERIKELAKLEKEEADRKVVEYQSALERQRKAEQILALLGL